MQLRSALLSVLLLLPATAHAGDDGNWPQWRGPRHDGTSTTTGLPTEWSAEENVLWKTALPSWSGATPVVWGERVFVVSPSKPESESGAGEREQGEPRRDEEREQGLMLQQEGGRRGGQGRERGRGQGGGGRGGGRAGRDAGGDDLLLLCVSAQDGALLWERKIDSGNAIYRKANKTSPSPVTDGEHVWVVTGNGQVTALDMDGDVVWKRNLQADYGPLGQKWGYASSPLLLDGRLVIQVLHGTNTTEPSYVVALDGESGEPVWKVERPTDAPRESPDAYTTPLPIGAGAETQVVILGGDYVTGHDARTGAELWRVGGLNPNAAPNYRICASPLMVRGVLIAPTRVRPLLAIGVGDELSPTDEDVMWRWEDRGAPDVPTPTSDGTYLYMVSDNGMVTCVDLATGEAVWGPVRTVQGTVSASPLCADGRLYVTNEEGITVVLRAGDEYEELAVNETDGSYTLSSPIACSGRLYLRTERFLYCIGER